MPTPPTVHLKPTLGPGRRTTFTLQPMDYTRLDQIKAAYSVMLGVTPSAPIVVSMALERLLTAIRDGELPRHSSLYVGA
jgi:hypothetical protein